MSILKHIEIGGKNDGWKCNFLCGNQWINRVIARQMSAGESWVKFTFTRFERSPIATLSLTLQHSSGIQEEKFVPFRKVPNSPFTDPNI